MKDSWWKRRKKRSPWFKEIHDELEKLGNLIDETMQKAFETSAEKPPIRRDHTKGFSVETASKGKPKMQEFERNKPWQGEEFTDGLEPLIDLIEDNETFVVLAVLPGVKKDDIDLRVTETSLTISVETTEFEWCDELRLPTRVNPKSAWASYKNGVLEVKLKKSEKIIRDSRISV